jgi:hypothetical protein
MLDLLPCLPPALRVPYCLPLLGIIGDGLIDRYRYYLSILSVTLTTNSIDLSVKIFSFLIHSINHFF